jgi:fructoselysine 6-kinase
MKIVCVGESTIDHYLDLNRDFVGGISLNFAVNAHQCGVEQVALVSCVGTDPGGERILAGLDQAGIDASHVKVLPGETTRQDIRMAAGGERIFPPGGFHLGVLRDYRLAEDDLAFIRRHDILAAPLYRQVETLFETAIYRAGFQGKRVADLLTWGDYEQNYERLVPLFQHLDLIFISGDQSTVAALRPLSHRYKGAIIVTQGANGSTALQHGETIHQAAYPVDRPVDTTGCGDAFQAAFTITYFRTGDLRQALDQGAAQAAQVIGHYGATDIAGG